MWLELDLVAKPLESIDKAAANSTALALVEVRGAQVMVGGWATEQVMDDDQQRVPDSDGCSILATPGSESMVLSG